MCHAFIGIAKNDGAPRRRRFNEVFKFRVKLSGRDYW